MQATKKLMTGVDIRQARLFPNGKNAVIVAVDHGQTFGPIPGLLDFTTAVERLGEADGILLAPAMIKFTGQLFCQRGNPLVITRLNWSTRHCVPWGYQEAKTVVAMSVPTAVRLGAEMVLASLILKTGSEGEDAENVEIFARIAEEAHDLGLPVIGEVFPPSEARLDKKELHDYIKKTSRIACELGADALKTFYTGDLFSEIIEGVPIPVLVLGSEKFEHELQALELANRAVQGGARGVVFGRNVTQAKDPVRFLKALKAVVKAGVEPIQAMADNGLDVEVRGSTRE